MKEYRFRKSYLVYGVLWTLLVLTVGVVNTLVALHLGLIALAIFFGVGLGGLTLLGMWFVLLSHRYRLFINPQEIRQVGSFRTRVLNLDEVSEAKWRPMLGGSLVLKGPSVRMVIEFAMFEDADREELIQFFKTGLVEAVQKDRERFEAIISPDPAVNEMHRRRFFRAHTRRLAFYAVCLALAGLFGFSEQYLALFTVIAALVGQLWLAKWLRL